MIEKDLYKPIYEYFSQAGYSVDGEVKDLDVFCLRDDQEIVIELKNTLNLKAITQGSLRQKLFHNVYIAIWTPDNLRRRSFTEKIYLLKRLGLGLILVSPKRKQVSVYMDPVEVDLKSYRSRNKKKAASIKKEMSRRRLKNNTGGVHREKIMSAYREDALIILGVLEKEGPMSGAGLKEITGIDKSYSYVYRNYYGWFQKESKGIYGLSKIGYLALHEYKKDIKALLKGIQ